MRAQAAAERLTAGVAAEVVVAAAAGRLGDELELSGVRLEFDDGLADHEVERFAVDTAGLEIAERLLQAGEVVLAHRGRDVEPVGHFASAVDDSGEGADEVFLTGTTIQVAPVVKVDEHVIADGAPGQMTLRLLDRYLDFVAKDVGSAARAPT